MTTLAHFRDPERTSLKRLAWAYGCAAKGSDEEAALLTILLVRLKHELTDHGDSGIHTPSCGCNPDLSRTG